MLIVEFDKNILNGGFGDRIVGLISLKTISTFLNTEFYIKWDKENITKIIDYSKYDYYNNNITNTKKHNIMKNYIQIFLLLKMIL
jgi:hypothetical protein